MQVRITLAGPMGSGKSVIAEFLAQQLRNRFLLHCEVQRGGNPRGPDHDVVTVETTPETLKIIAEGLN